MKQLRNLFTLISGILLILALGACTPTVETGDSQPAAEEPTAQPEKPEKPAEKVDDAAQPAADALDLDGSVWDLQSLDGANLSANGITMQLADGTISGSDGCNRYSSGYELANGKLAINGPFISTMMACPDADMELSGKYLQALESAGAVSLADGTLTIQTDQGELIFKAPESAGIENTKWVLNSTRTELGVVSMAIDEKIFFIISDSTASGDGGCNGFGANVTIDGLQINFSEIISTEMYCEGDGVSDREAEFLAVLENAASYKVLRQTLTFSDADGETIATFQASSS